MTLGGCPFTTRSETLITAAEFQLAADRLGKKDEIGTKYSSQTELCIMVGYTSSTKIWKLYSLERHHMSSHKIFTSADVKFDDNIFPNDGGKAPVNNDEGENDDLLKRH